MPPGDADTVAIVVDGEVIQPMIPLILAVDAMTAEPFSKRQIAYREEIIWM
jgi:hypothetical protein